MEELVELNYENLDRKKGRYFLGKKELIELERKSFEYLSGSGIDDWIGQDEALQRARRNREVPDDAEYYAVISTADISRGFPKGIMNVIFFKLKKPTPLKKQKVKKG
jgi:hypothetical protein